MATNEKTLTAAERIELIRLETKKNIKELSEALGYTRPQGLYDVASGRTKSISDDLANRIITAFPEFSKPWLLTGEGPMKVEAPNTETLYPDVVIPAEAWKVISDLAAAVRSQQEELRELHSAQVEEKKKSAVG